ncbi:MAG: DMT family transporter [Mucilaginibacter sp.]|uniref:DMT family transporter n=1 Tax=Mucilaginibacter sp. TaxID=1882438 RepID=UPI003262D241
MNPKLSLAIGIICISFSPIFVKLVPLAALPVAFYRLAFAWIFLAPYCFWKKDLRIGSKSLIIAIVGGLVFGLDIAVWNISILKSTATISTLIANLAPLWVGLLTLLIFKKQPGISFWLGTLIAICGMVILVGIQNILHLQLTEGVLYAVASSFLYAFYILITKDVLTRIDTLTFMFYSMLSAALFLGTVCFFSDDVMTGFSIQTWSNLVILGLICQLLGWITINYAIHHLDPTQVSLTLLSQAVITALLAWLMLGEKIHITEILGGIIVLIGIAFTFVKRRLIS